MCLGIVLFSTFSEAKSQGNRPIGTWKDFFPYGQVFEVAPADGVVYAMTEYAVFSFYGETNEINRNSIVQGLSESNPSAIAVAEISNEGNHILIIGYGNGNIDLLTEAGVYNMPDIVNSNLLGDKSIRNIYVEGYKAYLSTSFGVVVIDVESIEVSDTWYIKGQQDLLGVSGVKKHDGKWVVATDEGVFEADVNHDFLSSAEAWTQWDDLPEDQNTLVSELQFTSNRVFAHLGDGYNGRLWVKEEGSWFLMDGWPAEGDKIWGLDSRNDTLIVGTCCNVERYDLELNLIPETNAVGNWMQVRDVKFGKEEESTIWIASRIGGLIRFVTDPNEDSPNNTNLFPSGPESAHTRKLDCWNNNLWIATGGVDAVWNSNYTGVGVTGLVNNSWIDVVSLESQNDIQGIKDFLDVSIDPLNTDRVFFGSWEEGLVEVVEGEMTQIFNNSNSTIEEADFGGSYRTGIGGVDFDRDGNLWFTNAFTESPLQVLLSNGTFLSMELDNSISVFDNTGGVKCTRDGYVWVLLPRGGGVMVYDTNETPANTSDDDWRFLSTNEEFGALPSNYVYCIEEDLDGEIWLGTGSGPAIFYGSESLFNDGENTTASQILIQQDGNYQYLLETESITSIKFDGGNRKWVGTAGSGVYVLSDDGLTIEHQFSVENSPIPDNNIHDIAINHSNGEVFVATSRGLVSYLSEATNWDKEMEHIFVFPNPVDKFHNGPITIDGLAYQCTVHITDTSGRLIAEEQSMGGRAIWDGLLDDGTPAPYGVYFVFAVDGNGDKTASTKFAITR